MLYRQALEFLNSFGLSEIKLGLNRVQSLCEQLGNPQYSYKTVHVAGTNGKGSVVAFISSALREAGYRVGAYTSPHLVDFCERIQVDGKMISKNDVVDIVDKIKGLVDEHTYFEITTAIAFEYFRQENVEYAVIEVGLGGRLDATNVITPDVSVITGISMEHTEHLGESIDEISKEKAGIIKNNVPVVCLGNPVVSMIAADKHSELFVPDDSPVDISMNGFFQVENAQLAEKALMVLGIADNAIRKGLKTARWPGRMDMVSENLMFDCAHNPAAAKALARELVNPTMVIGIMRDKDIKGICEALMPVGAEFIIVRPEIDRAAEPEDILKYLPGAKIIPSVADALVYVKDRKLAVLTGSMYTVGEGYKSLGLEPFDTQIN